MIAGTARERLTTLGLILGLSACASLGYGRAEGGEEEDDEVVLYGTDEHRGDPPDDCKRLAKIEVTALESKSIPESKLKNAAIDEGGNAVGHIRKAGFSDGYLGKEYSWRAVAFRCPKPKAKPSPSASAGAAPAASSSPSSKPVSP